MTPPAPARAVPLRHVFRRGTGPCTSTMRASSRSLRAAVGIERRCAVRADDAEVLQSVVGGHTVDVVEGPSAIRRPRPTRSPRPQSSHLRCFRPSAKQPLLEVARVVDVPTTSICSRGRAAVPARAASTALGSRWSVGCSRAPATSRGGPAPPDGHIPRRLMPRRTARPLDRVRASASVYLGVMEHMFARDRTAAAGESGLNRFQAPKAPCLPIRRLPRDRERTAPPQRSFCCRGTRPASAPRSLGGAARRARCPARASPSAPVTSRSRPSVEETSRPVSSRHASSR